jgi:hypothetical protein
MSHGILTKYRININMMSPPLVAIRATQFSIFSVLQLVTLILKAPSAYLV